MIDKMIQVQRGEREKEREKDERKTDTPIREEISREIKRDGEIKVTMTDGYHERKRARKRNGQ